MIPRTTIDIGTWRSGDRWPALACLLTLAIAGCSNAELNTSYGRQQEARVIDSASVNGTDVLAGMFTRSGREVARRRVILSREFGSFDTVVWFPDDFGAPDEHVCDWLDAWLAESPGRTVIYVGRDFDAAPLYWRKIQQLVEPETKSAYQERAVEAEFSRGWQRHEAHDRLECPWFEIGPHEQRDADKLAGSWSQGIDGAKTEIELRNLLVPHAPVEKLLTSGDDVLVARQERSHLSGGQLILITNGSFLLNLPMINPEHRKLALRLVESTKPEGRVVFIESGTSGPQIDPDEADDSLWHVFGAWPLSAILLHLGVAGIIFCFARWPIFGRPRFTPADPLSDFGKHVNALGDLLRRTKDRQYALTQLAAGEISGAGGSAAGEAAPATSSLPRSTLSPIHSPTG